MSRLPAINVFEMPERPVFYRALQALGPTRAYRLMREVFEADLVLLAEQQEEMALRGRERMLLAPGLRRHGHLVELSAQFGRYPFELQFDLAFLAMWMGEPDVLFDEVVEVRGADLLRAVAVDRTPVILLPLHLGPAYAAPSLLAHFLPVTTLYHRIDIDGLRDEWFPGVDLRGIQVPGAGITPRCIEVVRSGRALSMFPELDPAGIGPFHEPVNFLGTTVMAPAGPVILSRKLGAVMMPFVVRALGAGRYLAEVLEPIEPPAGTAQIPARLDRLWQVIEEEVTRGQPGAWEMWFEFDDMVRPSIRKPVLT